MLTRKAQETLSTKLTVKGQGESVSFNITYHNRTGKQIKELVDGDKTIGELVLFVVKDWESEYPLTSEGLDELENERPGMLMAIMEGFHSSRRMEREKNS